MCEKLTAAEASTKLTAAGTTLDEFVSATASAKPVPGGGSVAALTAANGASLISMLCRLTDGKAGYEQHWRRMKSSADYCKCKSKEFLDAIDRDCAAFDAYMSALKMPKDTDERQKLRKEKLDEAVLEATYAPLTVAADAAGLFEYADYAIKHGNRTATSDGAIAVLLLRSAVKAALYNVRINLPAIKDEIKRGEIAQRAAELERFADVQEKTVLENVKL